MNTYIMEKIIIENVFTEEDKEFNRMMVNNALNYNKQQSIPDRRGGKMQMNNRYEPIMFKDRDYDFTSDILDDFSRKWGLSK